MPKKGRPAAPANNSNMLVRIAKQAQSEAAAIAEMMVDGVAMNAVTAVGFSTKLGELDLTECVAALTTTTERIKSGDLADCEALLAAQSVALNAIFTELSRRALSNMGQHLDAADRYMRLALKAQGQCRATVETLALMKNPPTVFARQANIAHGPQQVNNGTQSAHPDTDESSRAENLESAPNKLLEAHGERLDTGTARTSRRGDQALAPVGTLHRSAKRRR